MSYQIYFFKKRYIEYEKFNEYLTDEKKSEGATITVKDFIQIKDEVKKALGIPVRSGSKDEIFFENFQIIRHPNWITLSIPFWEENIATKALYNLSALLGVFRGKGYGGHDPQTERSIDDAGYNIVICFSESAEVVLNFFRKRGSE